jgi:hypothetical protein
VTSRIWFTAAQKAELWERWKNGQSAAAISRALERKNKTGVERIVVLHGGMVPAPRRRALAALRLEEREEISRGIAVGPVDPADRPGPGSSAAVVPDHPFLGIGLANARLKTFAPADNPSSPTSTTKSALCRHCVGRIAVLHNELPMW